MNLVEITRKLAEARAELAKNKEEYESKQKVVSFKILELQRLEKMAMGDLNLEKIALAEKYLNVYMVDKKLQGDDGWAIDEAIKNITKENCGRLKEKYFGTKNYDRWNHQGVSHLFGYGPAHGGVVFSVGLTKLGRDGAHMMNELEKDAMIYLLNNLKSGKYLPKSLNGK